MNRHELRIFLKDWFCGCGSPDMACDALRNLLEMHSIPYEQRKREIAELIPNEGIQYLIFYALDHFDLTEHGGTVDGAWLSDKGKAVLAALNRERFDNYDSLNENCCAHGYSIETDELNECIECAKLNEF